MSPLFYAVGASGIVDEYYVAHNSVLQNYKKYLN